MSERRRRDRGAGLRGWTRAAGLSLGLAGLLGGPARAQESTPAPSATAAPATTSPTGEPALVDPFARQTGEVVASAAEISDRVPEVEGLRGEAERLGQAARLSCIDEKLARIRRSLEASDVIRKSWPNARAHPDFAQRTLERLRLVKLYAISAADEAHRCTDGRPDASTVVKIDRAISEAGRPGDPVRPPVFERPPLASPY